MQGDNSAAMPAGTFACAATAAGAELRSLASALHMSWYPKPIPSSLLFGRGEVYSLVLLSTHMCGDMNIIEYFRAFSQRRG